MPAFKLSTLIIVDLPVTFLSKISFPLLSLSGGLNSRFHKRLKTKVQSSCQAIRSDQLRNLERTPKILNWPLCNSKHRSKKCLGEESVLDSRKRPGSKTDTPSRLKVSLRWTDPVFWETWQGTAKTLRRPLNPFSDKQSRRAVLYLSLGLHWKF